ncbi:MAG: RluA family pseudouridine synthase [Blautia sp.]|nr:RluA family pseudouridine synthase [Blautia sp.]
MTQFQIETCILYEDSDILVCRKPTGLAVQNARMGTMDLESGLKNHLALKQPDQIPYLAVIHRLDQPVEGILVFAKTPAAAKELNRQMTAGEMEKYYLAVTDRKPALPEGILEDELRKDGKTNTSQVVSKGTAGAKHARLSYRLWAELSDTRTRSGKRYLLEIHLDTGRHHQIRVQMSHAGMPLLGDRKYYPEDRSGLPLGLCAYRLDFFHPVSKKLMRFRGFPSGAGFQGFPYEAKFHGFSGI